MGDLDVWVPRDVPLAVKVSAGLGDVRLFENKSSGFGPRLEFVSPEFDQATRRLELDVSVGLGDVNVQYGS
jgi:lia operon protein LiaF